MKPEKKKVKKFFSTNKMVDLFYQLVIEEIKPSVCIEVGAREAEFSKKMARDLEANNKKIFAFEAFKENYDTYAPGIVENDFYSRYIEYYNVAISSVVGEVDFYVNKIVDGIECHKNIGLNSLIKRNENKIKEKINVDEIVKVPSTTIEDFLKRQSLENEKYVAWVDVEGALEHVLYGGMGTTLKNCQALFVEVEEFPFWKNQWLRKDVDLFLEKYGLFPVAKDNQYGSKQYNIIYLRQPFSLKETE